MTIALWCVLAAGFLPYFSAFVAKAGDRSFDNNKPRDWLARQTGYRARANAAQQNGFEAFPLFAAAVIIAHVVRGPQPLVDMLAMAFVAVRVVYFALYLADKSALRSLVWLIGLICVVGIFVAASI